MSYHLAQLNVAQMKAAMDDPLMADFAARLEEINTLAESSPGFIWRLKDEAGDATSIRIFDDPMVLVNMSVWADVESLRAFTYKTAHAGVMRQRKEWFHHFGKAYYVLWWISEGHIPSLEEARSRLEKLQQQGPGPEAFDFKTSYPMP